MKIGFSSFTLINQRQDKPQFLTSTRVNPQKSEPASAPAEDDPFTKRLKKQREALESLASLPSAKESSQQRASEKVGFLRQRLEMLKAMMRFASPEQLKNMAKELKSIARELGGAAKLLDNQGGGSAGITATPSVMQPIAAPSSAGSAESQAGGHEGAQEKVPTDAKLASIEAELKSTEEGAEASSKEGSEEDNAENAEKVAGFAEGAETDALGSLPSFATLIQNEDNRSRPNGPSASEHALRGVLTDAQKELREAVNELKIRLREEDKEARRELKKAEEDMAKADRAIAASTSDALYSSLGQLLPSSSIAISVLPSSINIEV
ncbi:hypothetical protein LCGC14_0154530 [marine sediment metagenome]|uniref:Uncharacterized protein n=1 Tax=marine sediment metagenome TaxID=412755 RepID=A0A0F9XF19_9ZZZZ|nr:hypothetical protein [Halomonas sp.]HDZ47054.1 hypothetical protein [Halomonas sp.]HEB06872.1 hypothetical protein [Halomonas sp.]